MYPWRAALLILLQYLEYFTGISAHLTAPIVVNVVLMVKTPLLFGAFTRYDTWKCRTCQASPDRKGF